MLNLYSFQLSVIGNRFLVVELPLKCTKAARISIKDNYPDIKCLKLKVTLALECTNVVPW